MILKMFEGGIHTSEDLHKKFNNTIVYAKPNGESTPIPVWIKAIEGSNVYYSPNWQNLITKSDWNKFDLVSCRPSVGVYNVVFKSPAKIFMRPLLLQRHPYRQWRFGINHDNISLLGVNGRHYNVFESFPTSHYESMFNPKYPTFGEALGKILNHEVKHIAFSPKISIMLGKNRILMFKNFIPFLAYHSGIPFAVNEVLPFVKDEHEKYANLLSNAVGQAKIK